VPSTGLPALPDPMEIPTTPSPAPAANEYVVQSGDSLWTIAVKLFGDGTRSEAIFQANKDRLRTKNDLKVGQKLRLPLIAPAAASVAGTPVG